MSGVSLATGVTATSANTIVGQITTYNGIPTSGNGVVAIYSSVNAANLNANVGSSPLYVIPALAIGMYRISAYVILTTAATTSSTLPSIVIGWTDWNTSVVESNTTTPTSTANTVGTYSLGSIVVNAAGGSTITFATTGYLSSGATAMQYGIHIRLEALG